MKTRSFLVAGSLCFALGQTPATSSGPGSAQAILDQAYAALRQKDYDRAAAGFRRGLELEPGRTPARKDFAYALLAMGENEEARDHFRLIFASQPDDWHAGLEYAFLCHETKQQAEARRVFDRVRRQAPAPFRDTAEQAFENVDRPLREGIARWQEVVARDPQNFSGREELARLAATRGETALAAAEFGAAWKMRPGRRDLLVEWGRALKEAGQERQAIAVWLAASRGGSPRAAEQAREALPQRYPYVYEFRDALELEPANVALRRELAYLLLAMGNKDEARAELERVAAAVPADEQVRRQLADLAPPVPAPPPPPATFAERLDLAEASLRKSYLPDAVRYLRLAHELEPGDALVQLRLGQTLNLMQQDREALRWFDRARKSKDVDVAREADKAWKNLHPLYTRWRTTTWLYPFYSSRWQDAFTYGQVKSELKLGSQRVRPYVSMRFLGDIGRGVEGYARVLPSQLSESSLIFGGGVTASVTDHLLAWGEAGTAVRYATNEYDRGRLRADYRGGFAWFKGWGRLFGSPVPGWFAEMNADAVYVHRFGDDALFVTQTRMGRTFSHGEESAVEWQLLWNVNVTADARAQYWANFAETGPGVQLRWRGLPRGLRFGVHALRGSYLRNSGNPLRPNFNDFRAGFWYAFTR